MKKNRLKIYLIINIAIAIMEVIGLTMATLNRRGTTFQYYTQLSNLFLLVTSIMNIVYAIKVLTGKHKSIPRIVNVFSYSAICTTTVTLLVVLFVLSWMVGDLPSDIQAGRNFGLKTIQVRLPGRDKPDAGADFTVSSLSEAVDIILGK